MNATEILKFGIFRWFIKRHPRSEPAVRIPPLREDECRNMTVLKYLEAHHGGESDDDRSDSHYFTEHDLHGIA
jgi:hypothetical protein